MRDMRDDPSGVCARCARDDHSNHHPYLADICVGCVCEWTPTEPEKNPMSEDMFEVPGSRLRELTDAARRFASLTSPETIEKLVSWIEDASGALGAATTIGMRSCRPGDGLHYANHDRLIREAKELVAVLRSVEEGTQ